VTRLEKSAVSIHRGTLIDFFNEKFGSTSLPSHDLDHHIRVWVFAAEIVSQLRNKGYSFNEEFIMGLQIASMTHDLGLTVDRGESHGKAGRDIVSGYLTRTGLSPAIRAEVLTAVENHDRKDYLNISPPDSMSTILSVADDLDAFGYAGIYRYTEIYLERGISPAEIGKMVLNNLSGRFMHMNRVYGFLAGFISNHTSRFETTRDFFNPEGPFPVTARTKIISLIEKEIAGNRTDISEICISYRGSEDLHIARFFTNLRKELLMLT
jgi:HD superfamily phosphodiesterase